MDDPLIGQLLLQLILILVNAFFACAEIAVISLNDLKLKKSAEAGDKRAQSIVKLTSKPARFLATIQVGVTLAGFLGSAFAADNFSDRLVAWLMKMGVDMPAATLDTIAVVVITLVLSYFTLVLGELVPKRIAMQKAEPIAMAVGRILNVLSRITAPLVWLLTASTNGMLRLLGMNPEAEEEHVTEEEIRIMVDLGEEKGTIEPEEGEMIDNVLELGNKTAVEVMTHRTDLTVLWMEDSSDEWEKIILETNYSRYPVFGEDMDDLIGILYARDFLSNFRKEEPLALRELIRPAYMVPETVYVDVLLREMKQNRTHMAVVVDEYGGISGVATMEDILEEIVGEIEDEYDQEEPDIITIGENKWRVRGTIALSTLSDELCVSFPQGEYETLGGLIFSQMTSIPVDGMHPEITIAGLKIRVEALQDRRVEWAELSMLDDGNAPDQ